MTIKLAIVGSGFGMYCLLPAFNKINNCKVVSICGKNSERMESYCKTFGLKRYNNWRQMLQKEKPDAVAIAVIPKYQFEIAKYSLENNIAVFAEKPLTISYNTSFELNELAKKVELPNMIDFEFPEIPEWKKVKEILETKLKDKISNINVDWTFLSYDLENKIKSWKTDSKQGGGALSLVFSHTFYYLEYFLGPITDIQSNLYISEKSLNKGETTIDMVIKFQNNCTGNLHIDISNSENNHHVIEFNGKNEKLILQNHSKNLVDNFEIIFQEHDKIQKIKPDNSYKNINQSEDPRVKTVSLVAEKFINWCNTGISKKPDFEDGLRVQELMDKSKLNKI